MKYNVCTVQPPGYIHAHAFDEVATLISAGLKDLGFPVEVHKNKIDASAKNIVIGCHLLDSKSANIIPDNTIILNTEQLSEEIGSWNANILFWLKRFEAWDYSKKNIANIIASGLPAPKHLVLGYHPSLKTIKKEKVQDIDVLFYGSMNERRRFILQGLADKGLSIKHLFGVYGSERDHWISRSRIVLNMHFFNSKIFEIVRCFYLMINEKVVVSEIDDQTSIDEIYRLGVDGINYEGIIDHCVELSRNDIARNQKEKQAVATIKQLPQSKIMSALVSY